MRYLLLGFLVFVVTENFGQSVKIDSLKRLIDKEGDTKQKVELFNQLSLELFGYDVETAGATTDAAVSLAKKIKDRQGEGWAVAYRGVYFLFSGDLTAAEEYANRSLQIGKELQNSNLQGYALNQLGNVYRDRGGIDSAFYFYLQAEQARPDSYYTSVVHMNKARCYLILNKPDSALAEVQEVVRLRQSLQAAEMMPDVWLLMANCYRQKSELKEAEKYLELVYTASSKSSLNYAGYLLGMGEVYFIRGDFQKALANWTQVLAFHRKLKYRYELAALLLRMGEGLVTQGYYDLANEHLLRGLDISEKASYQYLRGSILHQLTWVNFRVKNYQLALQNSKLTESTLLKMDTQLALAACWDLRGLIYRQLKNYDSSLYFHNKGLRSRLEIGNKVEISAGLFNIGEFYLVTRQFDLAKSFYTQSLAIDSAIPDDYGRSLNYNRIGNIYLQLGVLDSAKIYLDKSALLAVPNSAMEVMRDNYLDLATYMVKAGNPIRAIEYYRLNNKLTDSLFNKRTAESLSSYRTLYDVERGEKEIELLNKNVQINKEQVQKQRAIIFATLIVVFMLAALAVSYFMFNKKLQRLNFTLAERNDKIQVQAKDLSEANEVLLKLNREVNEQKEEMQAQSEEMAEANASLSELNKALAEKQKEIAVQNEELTQNNEEISTQRDLVHQQNQELERIKKVVILQNDEIKSRNERLEIEVENRTKELVEYNQQLEQFAFISSHNLRAPVARILGLGQILELPNHSEQDEILVRQKIVETTLELDRVVKDLNTILEIKKNNTAVLTDIDLEEALNLVKINLGKEIDETQAQIETDFANVSTIKTIRPYLDSILVNLISNSIRYRSPDRFPLIRIRTEVRGSFCCLIVQDNGLGINLALYKDKLFSLYKRFHDHVEGKGLGLYLIKTQVAALGGKVEVESEVNVGTTFYVYIKQNSQLV